MKPGLPAKPYPRWSRLCKKFAAAFPPERHAGMGLVVAVSGGADSVALLRLLVDIWTAGPSTHRRSISVAHFNHATRGTESDGDQRFVAKLAEDLGIEFNTRSAEDWVADRACLVADSPASGSPAIGFPTSEEQFRRQRYRFLRECVASRGARYLLTAHTADDQVETLLHHLLRGTGPAGLCGIPARRPLGEDFLLVRPLLEFRRQALRDGLEEIGQAWREDSSNDELVYQRNWIRGELLPLIRDRYPLADDAILRLVDTQSRWQQALREQAQQWFDAHVRILPPGVHVRRGPVAPAVLGLAIGMIWDRLEWPRQRLAKFHHQLLWQLVCSPSADVAPDRNREANRAPVATDLPGGIRARVLADEVRIEPTRRNGPEEI